MSSSFYEGVRHLQGVLALPQELRERLKDLGEVHVTDPTHNVYGLFTGKNELVAAGVFTVFDGHVLTLVDLVIVDDELSWGDIFAKIARYARSDLRRHADLSLFALATADYSRWRVVSELSEGRAFPAVPSASAPSGLEVLASRMMRTYDPRKRPSLPPGPYGRPSPSSSVSLPPSFEGDTPNWWREYADLGPAFCLGIFPRH